MVFIKAVKCAAFGMITLTFGGCAVGVGLVYAALLRSISYSPDIDDVLSSQAMIAFSLIETFLLVAIIAIVGVYSY